MVACDIYWGFCWKKTVKSATRESLQVVQDGEIVSKEKVLITELSASTD